MDKRLDTLVLVVIIATVLILFALTFKTWQILQSQEHPKEKFIPGTEKSILENRSLPDSRSPGVQNGIPDSNNQNIDRADSSKTSQRKQLNIDSPTLDLPTRKERTNPENKEQQKPIKKAPYIVMAGAFSQHENALKMTDKLRKIGYDAGIIQSTDGKIERVIAGKFTTRDLAEVAVQELSARGIDSYVKQQY